MKKKTMIFLGILLVAVVGWLWFSKSRAKENQMNMTDSGDHQIMEVSESKTSKIRHLEDGLSYVRYDDDYGFQGFLDAGGASSDEEVLQYLMDHVLDDTGDLAFLKNLFGCSTIQTRNAKGDVLFGRNFDWEHSNALIIQSYPENAYASVSTVNLDFIQSGTSMPIDQLPDDVLAKAALYAPLDGMNEKGLAVSVNMIQDSDVIAQSGENQNLTTTTAIRLLLNKAANVEEAVELLRGYNLHSSMGMMIHFAIADAKGRSVVVEYVNHEMNVIETPVVTNFYHSPGEKQTIGTSQSHERYDILMDQLKREETMEMDQVRDALNSVSKDNFGEFESTEWSIVYNLQTREIHYYHRENYNRRYVLHISE